MTQNFLRFLPSTRLFFLITDDFKKNLFDEFWGCQIYIGLNPTYVKSIPVYERKYQIARHNEKVEKEKAEHEAALKKKKR